MKFVFNKGRVASKNHQITCLTKWSRRFKLQVIKEKPCRIEDLSVKPYLGFCPLNFQ